VRRIIVVNPHRIWYLKSTADFYSRKHPVPVKYDWIFNRFLEQNCVAVVSGGRTLSPFAGLFRILNLNSIDFTVWKRINGVKLPQVMSLENCTDEDVIFFFSYGNIHYSSFRKDLISHELRAAIKKSAAQKIAHVSHFCYSSVEMLSGLKEMGVNSVIADAPIDVSSRLYERACQRANHRPVVHVLPFRPHSRFYQEPSSSIRINKIALTGSIATCQDPLFLDTYGSPFLQPLRATLAETALKYPLYFDSFLSTVSSQSIDPPKNAVIRTINDLTAIARILVRPKGGGQRRLPYMSNQNNAVYSRYVAFLNGEEVDEHPSVGFVEGMASGCVLIASDSQAYRDLGMKDGVHFLQHDGTIGGIIDKFSFYLRRPRYMKKISQAGRSLIINIKYDSILERILSK